MTDDLAPHPALLAGGERTVVEGLPRRRLPLHGDRSPELRDSSELDSAQLVSHIATWPAAQRWLEAGGAEASGHLLKAE